MLFWVIISSHNLQCNMYILRLNLNPISNKSICQNPNITRYLNNYLILYCHTLYDPPRTSARLPQYRQDDSETTVAGSQRDTNIIWTYHVIIIKTVLRQYLALLYWAALISMFMNIIAWGLQVIWNISPWGEYFEGSILTLASSLCHGGWFQIRNKRSKIHRFNNLRTSTTTTRYAPS